MTQPANTNLNSNAANALQLANLEGTDDVTQAPTGLDANSLLAYCTSRLNSLDSMIQNYFAQQQAKNKELQGITKTIGDLNTFTGGVTEGAGDKGQFADNHTKLGNDLIADYNTATDPDVRAKIAKFYQEVTGKDMSTLQTDANGQLQGPAVLDTTNIKGISNVDWQAQIADLKNNSDAMSKDNELSMISLQSLVSQRQLAVQLTTQMMQTLNDGYKQIVGNIRTS